MRPSGSPHFSLKRKGKEGSRPLSTAAQKFSQSRVPVTIFSLFMHLGNGHSLPHSTHMTRPGAQCQKMSGGCLSLLSELLQEANNKPESPACAGSCRILKWPRASFQNQRLPDQYWFLLSMNSPSSKVLVLSVGEEIYNVNRKDIFSFYFSLLPPHLLCFYKNLAELIR